MQALCVDAHAKHAPSRPCIQANPLVQTHVDVMRQVQYTYIRTLFVKECMFQPLPPPQTTSCCDVEIHLTDDSESNSLQPLHTVSLILNTPVLMNYQNTFSPGLSHLGIMVLFLSSAQPTHTNPY